MAKRVSNNCLKIHTRQLKKADYSLALDGACMVRFMNRGQNYVYIDEQFILDPGDAYVEGDINGPGIDHVYRIEFITNPTPPTPNAPIVYSGNHLEIRIQKRH